MHKTENVGRLRFQIALLLAPKRRAAIVPGRNLPALPALQSQNRAKSENNPLPK